MHTALRSTVAAALAAGGLMCASFPGFAAEPAVVPMQRGNAVCDGVQQDRSACMREMGAARQEARRGNLTSAAPNSYEQNALARCSLQPPSEQAACEARVRGTGMTSFDGSVMGGGVIRETVTPVPTPIR